MLFVTSGKSFLFIINRSNTFSLINHGLHGANTFCLLLYTMQRLFVTSVFKLHRPHCTHKFCMAPYFPFSTICNLWLGNSCHSKIIGRGAIFAFYSGKLCIIVYLESFIGFKHATQKIPAREVFLVKTINMLVFLCYSLFILFWVSLGIP